MNINTDFVNIGKYFFYYSLKLLIRAYFKYFLAKIVTKLVNHKFLKERSNTSDKPAVEL